MSRAVFCLPVLPVALFEPATPLSSQVHLPAHPWGPLLILSA